jgi:hypothetical protein
MSRGKNLQEMETGTKQSKTAVNANAKPAESMPKLTTGIPDGQTGNWEDLGGPTVDNYRPDDDSAKLKDPSSSLKQVKDVVNKSAKSAEAMKKMASPVKESSEEDEDEELVEGEYDDNEDELEESAKKPKSDDEDEDNDEEDEDEDEDDEDDEDEKTKQMKEVFAQIEQEIEEDVSALLSGEDLSEEFKEKAKTVFETALNARTQQIEEVIAEEYTKRLEEEILEIAENIQERVDAYLEYVSEEWIQENALIVENGLKTEMTESFLQGMKSLFEEHYVEIPEEKYNVLESMVEKLDDMETKLNEQIEKNISLTKRLSESVADRIFNSISEGLATTQKEKLASLSESVEFESESGYREKLETLKESYFPSRVVSSTATVETLSEGVDVVSEYHSDSMNAYLRTLSTVAKR